MKPFSHINLSQPMLENLEKLEYRIMTPVQEWSIPPILKGRDVLAQAKTGSGKTAAFGIGLLENLNLDRYRVQSLILCPTRELAEQVAGEIRRLARFQHNIKVLCLTGGVPVRVHEHTLSHQAHIVVGTPGRIEKLLSNESLILEEVQTVVLDEADRMLDMGFIDQIHRIFEYAPEARQTLLFSATFPEEIRELCSEILENPTEVTVESLHSDNEIAQHFFQVPTRDRGRAVMNLLMKYKPESAVVFCNTKDVCRRLQKELTDLGVHCLAIHGDLEQKERNEVLVRFSNGSSPVLIATDVAARGLDIRDLGAVINYNLPFESETYIHRIGRTGRAGKEGLALSIIKEDEQFRLDRINEMVKGSYVAESVTLVDEYEDFQPPMVTLSVNGGRKNKISAGDIVGALTSGGIPGDALGKIDRTDFITFVAVERGYAESALKVLREGMIKGRRFRAQIH